MARGFHNAPKLYHDPTVNDIPQVISIRSGFREAGLKVVSDTSTWRGAKYSDMCIGTREMGFYFGLTGLVTHPRDGFKDDGAMGLLKGFGKAVGGVFFKPTAGT